MINVYWSNIFEYNVYCTTIMSNYNVDSNMTQMFVSLYEKKPIYLFFCAEWNTSMERSEKVCKEYKFCGKPETATECSWNVVCELLLRI